MQHDDAARELAYQTGLVFDANPQRHRDLMELLLSKVKIEILHERDPDSSCDLTVWIDGREVAADVVNIDPGAGHEREDWDESAAYDVADERDRSYAFKSAIGQAYDVAGQSKYITD